MQLCYSLLRNLETISKLTYMVLFSSACEFAFSRKQEGSRVYKNSKTIGTSAAAFPLLTDIFKTTLFCLPPIVLICSFSLVRDTSNNVVLLLLSQN